jgi:hypothetical protein
MKGKVGFYIGDALIKHPNAAIQEILFKNIPLGTQGLFSMLEAANVNRNIKSMHIGIVTDEGLKTVAESMGYNSGNLVRLELQEGKLLLS